MGLGVLGRGLGDARFIAECGAEELVVTDQKSEEELQESVAALKEYPNIRFTLGGHFLEDFRNRDLVIKGAGVPLDSPYIEEARKSAIPVRMSSALFVELTRSAVIGVTGTRGKTTTAFLIRDILAESGKRVFLGGNAQQLSTLEHLPYSSADEVVVLELDSWQLQGFREAGISPHLAVFTSFMPDHMNYYKGDDTRYLDDKAQIFMFQNEDDFLILGEQCASLVKKAYPEATREAYIARRDELSQWKLPSTLSGEHNERNAACAVSAARVLGVKETDIKRAVCSFAGVPYRLEYMCEYKGICFYNDTTATTPEATIAALEALGEERGVVLIIGGADKELDPSALPEKISKYCTTVVLLPGTGSDRIRDELYKKRDLNILEVSSMEEAVGKAYASAKRGDVVLLSPAFASFGLFDNEFQRGDSFKEAVGAITD